MNTNDRTGTPDRHSAYFDAMRELDETLKDALERLRAREDAGEVTPLEVAAERVSLLERHLAECRRLRGELDAPGEGR